MAIQELVEAAQALETVLSKEKPCIIRKDWIELWKRKRSVSFKGKPSFPNKEGGGQ
jgi:SpoVK/Ycf46/Vps4 family AAA+-type ATPase